MTFSADDLDESNARQIERREQLIRSLKASAWEEGAMWAAVEAGVTSPGAIWLDARDNPYRELPRG